MPRLDLNLLMMLDALLRERSVTRAAERLGLTQPTVSASLARLRRHYDDELLYRSGNTYDLTPLATHLAGRTGAALDGVERVFAAQSSFDPATSEREFVIICSDYGAAVIGPRLLGELNAHAPGMRIRLRQMDHGSLDDIEDKLRVVDGLLTPHGRIQGIPHLNLLIDRWVCLIAEDNAQVGDELTMDDLSRLPWAATSRGPSSATALHQLTQRGVRARVQVVVDAFLGLPYFIPNTDRIALMPYQLARQVQAHYGLRILECPFDPGPLVEALWWHPDYERDAEHAWLRSTLAALATSGPDRDWPT